MLPRAEWNATPANRSRPAMSGSGPVELADRADDGVGSRDSCGRPSCARGRSIVRYDRPRRPPRPRCRSGCGRAARSRGAAREVLAQHALRREVLRPVVGREGVRVDVVRAVDAAAGIRVLEPRPADVGVLLDDRVGDVGLLQADGREQPRHAGADDQDVEFPRACAAGTVSSGTASVPAVQRQLRQQELDVVAESGWPMRKCIISSRPRRTVAAAARPPRRGRCATRPARGPGCAPAPPRRCRPGGRRATRNSTA